MRIGPSPRRTQARFSALLSAVLIAGVPATALAGPADRYYERSFVVAAHQRCNLFQPQLAAALNAAAWQARGAALRSGADDRQMAETAARARAPRRGNHGGCV